MIFNNFYKIAKFNKITKFSNYYSLQFRGIVDRRPDVYYTSSKKFNRELLLDELTPPPKNLEPVHNEQRSVYDTRPPSKKFLLDILRQPYLEPVHNKPKVPPPPRNLDPVHNKSSKYNPPPRRDLDSVYKKTTKYNHPPSARDLYPVHNKSKVPPPPRDLDPVHNKPLKYNPKKDNE